ncbi:MAG TPA: phytanoyl-CoA dioxygenase family protein [Acidimicrobiia bacterium]|nr:phytanoyl-CoA dioxygenase family protein [Acidimicrobiia bacterium]
MTAPTRSTLAREIGVFTAPEYDGLPSFFAEHGFAIMRGLYPDARLRELEVELARQQQRLLAGELPEVCGTVILDDPDAVIDGEAFAHYVCHLTEVSPLARDAAYHPALVAMMSRLLGPEAWLLEDDRFGVVYQDARPGAQSGYSRIGWHSDRQSGPHLRVWPSVAFTIHVDATSPCNGFLRIVPGSHRGGTDEMPLGFEHVPGEMALYCERGDVLLHHCDLWHGAARATDDGDAAIRRHVRGAWYGGERLAPNHGLDDFVKNARR